MELIIKYALVASILFAGCSPTTTQTATVDNSVATENVCQDTPNPPYHFGVYYFPGNINDPAFSNIGTGLWWNPDALNSTRMEFDYEKPFPERKPLLGWYENIDQSVMDAELNWMADYGVNLVVFDWYWRQIPNKPMLDQAIRAYKLSKSKCRVNFSIMWSNDAPTRLEAWNASPDLYLKDFDKMVQVWITQYFSEKTYLKKGGKPVVYIFGPGNVGGFNAPAGFGKATVSGEDLLIRARSAAIAAGLPGIYFVSLDDPALGNIQGYDAVSAYDFAPVNDTNTGYMTPVADDNYGGLVKKFQRLWPEYISVVKNSNQIPFYPIVGTGWDSRARVSSPFLDKRGDIYVADAPQFKTVLQAAKQFLTDHPTVTDKTVMACCWNEFGEGTIMAPSVTHGFQILEQINSVFGPVPLPPATHIFIGNLDTVAGEGTVVGWAADRNAASSSTAVSFYLSQTSGSPVFLGATLANEIRPDVNSVMKLEGNHGFTFHIPAQYMDGQTHVLSAFTTQSDSGAGTSQTLIGSQSTNLSNNSATLPRGSLDEVTPSGIARGWTADTDQPVQSLAVHFFVVMDHTAAHLSPPSPAWWNISPVPVFAGAVLANHASPDVEGVYPWAIGNHRFEFNIPFSIEPGAQFRDGVPHLLYAWAIDANGWASGAPSSNPSTQWADWNKNAVLLGGSPIEFTAYPDQPSGSFDTWTGATATSSLDLNGYINSNGEIRGWAAPAPSPWNSAPPSSITLDIAIDGTIWETPRLFTQGTATEAGSVTTGEARPDISTVMNRMFGRVGGGSCLLSTDSGYTATPDPRNDAFRCAIGNCYNLNANRDAACACIRTYCYNDATWLPYTGTYGFTFKIPTSVLDKFSDGLPHRLVMSQQGNTASKFINSTVFQLKKINTQ